MRRARPRPWVFGLSAIPYGSFSGLIAIGLPYLLRGRGVSVDRISTISAFVQAPAIWYVLWSPIVDLKFRRRTWVMLLSVSSALCAAVAVGVAGATALRMVTTLLFAASVLNQPVSSALGGLAAAVMPNEMRGRAAGWTQGGILGGAVLAGGLAVWLTAHSSALLSAMAVGLLIGAPGFAVLAVRDPVRTKVKWRTHVARMLREIVSTLRRREVWLAFGFFLSPVGAGALMYLFSAVATDFRASTAGVMWVVVLGGIMAALGAIVGGILADRFDRWRIYAMSGLITGAAAGAMGFAPLTPATYVVGASAYALATGIAYAAFMALALQLLGSDTAASGTRFTLFMAAVNAPVVYMLRLDGVGHAHFGVRGMLAVDAIANIAFGVLLLVILLPFRAIAMRGVPKPDASSAA